MDCLKPLRRWRLILMALICFFLGSFSRADVCDSILMNGSDVWQPVSYRAGGQLTGIVPDVLKSAFAKTELQLAIAPAEPWKRLLDNAAKGKIDIVAGAYGNVQRDKTYLYSDVIFQDEVRVFVRKGREFTFQALTDLVGKVGAIPLGASYGVGFDAFAKENLQLFEPGSYFAMFQMLELGRVDYIILAYFDGMAEIQRTQLAGVISILPKPVVTNDVYALFSKASPCSALLPVFNHQLKALRNSGELQRIINTHIRAVTAEMPK